MKIKEPSREQKITASISIGRASNDEVRIAITDEASGTRFLSVSMTPHDFAMAITGLSFIEVPAIVCGLENVGQKKITERRSVLCPLDCYDRKILEQWLLDNCQEDGWLIRPYLGSQNSIGGSSEGGRRLNYSVYRFESVEGEGK